MLLANRNENNRSSFNFGKFQRCFCGVAGGGAAPAVLGLPPFVLCHHLQQVGSEHGLNFEDELRVCTDVSACHQPAEEEPQPPTASCIIFEARAALTWVVFCS